jgi:hypothetical protein
LRFVDFPRVEPQSEIACTPGFDPAVSKLDDLLIVPFPRRFESSSAQGTDEAGDTALPGEPNGVKSQHALGLILADGSRKALVHPPAALSSPQKEPGESAPEEVATLPLARPRPFSPRLRLTPAHLRVYLEDFPAIPRSLGLRQA